LRLKNKERRSYSSVCVTRNLFTLSSFTKDFGQNDPAREYRFRGWFLNSNVGEILLRNEVRATLSNRRNLRNRRMIVFLIMAEGEFRCW